MNAKEISDSTLPAVTPDYNDLMLIYDTSEGTTGKATIVDIIQKGVLIDGLSLYNPTIQRDKSDSLGIEGGEIHFQCANNSDMTDVTIDVYKNTVRFFTTINNVLKMFTLDFENKTAYWN